MRFLVRHSLAGEGTQTKEPHASAVHCSLSHAGWPRGNRPKVNMQMLCTAACLMQAGHASLGQPQNLNKCLYHCSYKAVHECCVTALRLRAGDCPMANPVPMPRTPVLANGGETC